MCNAPTRETLRGSNGVREIILADVFRVIVI